MIAACYPTPSQTLISSMPAAGVPELRAKRARVDGIQGPPPHHLSLSTGRRAVLAHGASATAHYALSGGTGQPCRADARSRKPRSARRLFRQSLRMVFLRHTACVAGSHRRKPGQSLAAANARRDSAACSRLSGLGSTRISGVPTSTCCPTTTSTCCTRDSNAADTTRDVPARETTGP